MPRLLLLALLAALTIVPTSPVVAASVPASRASTPHRVVHHHARRAAKLASAAVLSRDTVSVATLIGEEYWGGVPCGGHVKVLTNMPLPPGLDPSTDAWVTFDSSLGANNVGAPPATYTGCTISFSQADWPTRTVMERNWGMFCLTMVHEMGHLLGHAHSLAPRSVMAPVFTSDANVPALCNANWLPGWRYGAAR